MDRFTAYQKTRDGLRGQTCELELKTGLTAADGTSTEIAHTRRYVCKRAQRAPGKTILGFSDIDLAALERDFPLERFTVEDWPELYVEHVGWRVPFGVGTVAKVPLAWVGKSGGVWTYAGPQVSGGIGVLQAVYRGDRPGEGAVVSASEYTAGTAFGAATGIQVHTVKFTREQIDHDGRPHVIEADYELPGNRAPSSFIQTILGFSGVETDTASVNAAIAADIAGGFLVDILIGSRTQALTGRNIVGDLLEVARGWLVPTASGALAIVQDIAQASSASYDSSPDLLEIEEYGDGEVPARVTIYYRPRASGGNDYGASLSRSTVGATGEKKIDNAYIRDHGVADRLLSYWQKRLNAFRVASASIHGVQVASGARISITDSVCWSGTRDFIAAAVRRGPDRNTLRLREYDESIYTYTPGALPAGATNGYSPDYTYTPPEAPTNLQVVSQGTSVATDGTLQAYAKIRATPPALNWEVLLAHVTNSGTGEIYQAELSLVAGNYEATVAGLRPGQNHSVIAFARNASNRSGAPTASVPFTSANSTNAPSAPTLVATQYSPKQIFLAWTPSSPGAGGTPIAEYRIQRKIGTFSYSDLTRVGRGLSYVDDDNVVIGTTYTYKITAIDRNGNEGTESNTPAVTPNKIIGANLITNEGVGTDQIAQSAVTNNRIAGSAVGASKCNWAYTINNYVSMANGVTAGIGSLGVALLPIVKLTNGSSAAGVTIVGTPDSSSKALGAKNTTGGTINLTVNEPAFL